MLLADMGYVVACVDGRGTGLKNAEFKKVTQKQRKPKRAEKHIKMTRPEKLQESPWEDHRKVSFMAPLNFFVDFPDGFSA